MDPTYEYYIWDLAGDPDTLQERIEKALREAGLQYEFKGMENY